MALQLAPPGTGAAHRETHPSRAVRRVHRGAVGSHEAGRPAVTGTEAAVGEATVHAGLARTRTDHPIRADDRRVTWSHANHAFTPHAESWIARDYSVGRDTRSARELARRDAVTGSARGAWSTRQPGGRHAVTGDTVTGDTAAREPGEAAAGAWAAAGTDRSRSTAAGTRAAGAERPRSAAAARSAGELVGRRGTG